MEVEVLAARSSDHKPLWVQFIQGSSRPSRSFKYEACWDKDEESAKVIKTEWEKSLIGENPLSSIMEKLESCAVSLASWNRAKYWDVSKRLNSLTKKLENLQAEQRADDRDEIRQLQGEINHLLEMDDIKWRQRAKERLV